MQCTMRKSAGDTDCLRSSPLFARSCLPQRRKRQQQNWYSHPNSHQNPKCTDADVWYQMQTNPKHDKSSPPAVGRKRHADSDSFNASAPARTPASRSPSFKPSSSGPSPLKQPSQTLGLTNSCSSSASPHPGRPFSALALAPTSRLVQALTNPHSFVEKVQSAAVRGACSRGGRGLA